MIFDYCITSRSLQGDKIENNINNKPYEREVLTMAPGSKKKKRNDTTPSLFVANVLSVMMNESSALCWGKENKFTWLLFIHFLIVYLLKINPASPRQSRAGSRCPARTFGLYVSRLGLAVVRSPFLPSRGRCRHRQ